MRTYTVRVHPSIKPLPKEEQLAWKIAETAADRAPVDDDVAGTVVNRLIDNAAVALATLDRWPV